MGVILYDALLPPPGINWANSDEMGHRHNLLYFGITSHLHLYTNVAPAPLGFHFLILCLIPCVTKRAQKLPVVSTLLGPSYLQRE